MLADRVQARLDALGISANKASVSAGLGRDYVRDILRNKVREPSADRLERLAAVLRCEVAYLLGSQAEPGKPKSDYQIRTSSVPISYRIRPGFHKDDDGSVPPIDWPVKPLTGNQKAEWLERVEADALVGEIPAGALLHVSGDVVFSVLKPDDLVVMTETYQGTDLLRRSVRRLWRFGFSLNIDEGGDDEYPSINEGMISKRGDAGLQIEGVVLAIYRYLDPRTERRTRG